MFTGIINHCGTVTNIKVNVGSSVLWVDSQYDDLAVGESIAVDGVCLTVSRVQHTQFLW